VLFRSGRLLGLSFARGLLYQISILAPSTKQAAWRPKGFARAHQTAFRLTRIRPPAALRQSDSTPLKSLVFKGFHCV
jgi:hypothetical protein